MNDPLSELQTDLHDALELYQELRRVDEPIRVAAFNPVTYVSIGSTDVEPRRQVVDPTACNACHDELRAHSDARRNVEYCATCHIATASEIKQIELTLALFAGITLCSCSDDDNDCPAAPTPTALGWRGSRTPTRSATRSGRTSGGAAPAPASATPTIAKKGRAHNGTV